MFDTNKKLTGNMLKLIAIIAMTIDHAAWLLFPLNTIAAQICHVIGRLTFPIFAYMIVEGFHHTRNVKKYVFRLALFALAAHFAYAFCFNHPYIFNLSKGIVDTTSVLWGFTFGVLALIIYHHKTMQVWLKILLIAICITVSLVSDWSWVCVVLLLVIDMNYLNFKRQMLWMTIVCWLYALVFCLVTSWWSAYQFAIIIAFPVLHLYNGKRGTWKGMKWLFYIYYPLHLVLLGIIRVIFKISY
jgi:hypothetical protein